MPTPTFSQPTFRHFAPPSLASNSPPPLRIWSQSRPSIPEVYKIFQEPKYSNDEIEVQIQPFVKLPSLNKMFDLILNEVWRWDQFVTCFNTQQKKLLRLEVAQISGNRFPGELSVIFVPHSLICRVFYRVQITQPIDRQASPNFAVALYFAQLRKLPDFIRNLANETVTRCNIGTVDWMMSLRNSLAVRNSSNTTYDSAVRQLSKDFGYSLDEFKTILVDPNSFISDDFLMNIIMNKVLQEIWGSSRAVTAICGLKNIGSANNIERFHNKTWSTFENACRISAETSVVAPQLLKNLKPRFALRIYYAAVDAGNVRHQECLRFIFITWQREGDYTTFRVCNIFWSKTFVDLHWPFSKTRSRNALVQNTKVAFGKPGTFFDIKTCLETLIITLPRDDIFLLNMKDDQGKSLSLGALLRFYAQKVPVIFHTLPLKELSMHCVKYMGSYILSQTKNLHPQVACHYLRHSNKDPEFRAMIQRLFPVLATQWFAPTSLQYVLHNDHLEAVGIECQRIWDRLVKCIEEERALEIMQNKLGETANLTPGT